MRAWAPDQSGSLQAAGFQIGYEVFGQAGRPAVLLLPAWQIVHSRVWKMQVPFLARSFHVITFDMPGNGGGERTLDRAAYDFDRTAEQAAGLLDHLGVAQADVVGFSRGCAFGLLLAARWPARVRRLILIAGSVAAADWPPPDDPGFRERRTAYHGWEKANAHYWREHYADWLSFFFSEVFSEPHSTKAIDDCIRWGLETTPEILIRTASTQAHFPARPIGDLLAGVRCPVLLIHGDDDRVNSIEASRSLAAARPDWEFVTLAGAGHAPNVRDPVRVNLLISEFLNRAPAQEGPP